MSKVLVLGAAARLLTDRVSLHFTVRGLTKGRGWWEGDVEGEALRYDHLCTTVLEPAREILGVPMVEISGARPIGHNETGRASSMHLPPVQRVSVAKQYLSRPKAQRGAALDFHPDGMRCDDAYWKLDAAQRDGRIRPGGLFWYKGPDGGLFLHIDDRGTIARERDKIPPAPPKP